MAAVTVSSQRLPAGTSVSAYSRGQALRQSPDGPAGSAIASATVASTGTVSISDAGLLAGQQYIVAGQVGGRWEYCQATAA